MNVRASKRSALLPLERWGLIVAVGCLFCACCGCLAMKGEKRFRCCVCFVCLVAFFALSFFAQPEMSQPSHSSGHEVCLACSIPSAFPNQEGHLHFSLVQFGWFRLVEVLYFHFRWLI